MPAHLIPDILRKITGFSRLLFATVVCLLVISTALPVFAEDKNAPVTFTAHNFAYFKESDSHCYTDPNPKGCKAKIDDAGFHKFAADVGAVLAPPVVSPGGTLGISGTSIQVVLNGSFIGKNRKSEPWLKGTNKYKPGQKTSADDKARSGYMVGHLLFRKGLPGSVELNFNTSYLFDSNVFALGGGLRWAPFEGYSWFPDISIGGRANVLFGLQEMNIATAAAEVLLSKSFGLGGVLSLTPTLGYQAQFTIAGANQISAKPELSPLGQDQKNEPTGFVNTGVKLKEIRHRFLVNLGFDIWLFSVTLEGSYALGGIIQAGGSLGIHF